MFKCDLCKEIIEADIVRVDGDTIFHLDCFERFMHPERTKQTTYACPKCKTTGKYWSTSQNGYKMCKLCNGSGYLYEDIIKILEQGHC